MKLVHERQMNYICDHSESPPSMKGKYYDVTTVENPSLNLGI